MKIPVKGNVEIITKKNWKRVKQEFEDSVLRCWKTSKFIVPKMNLDFRVWFQEVYASTVGRIFTFTPFWRGRTFTDGILMHEFLHWSIYPIDMWNGIKDVFTARRMLAEDLNFTPEIKETDLFGQVEIWKDFPHPIKEIQFCQNILGDYLINIHIHDYHGNLWSELWKFLFYDGTFYEQQKALNRDTTFLLYLSVYPELLPKLQTVTLLNPKTEEDKEKVAEIISEVRKGRMSKPFAIKELVRIFHSYIEKDIQDAKDGKKGKTGAKGKGKGASGKAEDPKCPKCGHDEFEVTGYEDPKTGKWVDV